jgi:hypothetical protein
LTRFDGSKGGFERNRRSEFCFQSFDVLDCLVTPVVKREGDPMSAKTRVSKAPSTKSPISTLRKVSAECDLASSPTDVEPNVVIESGRQA